MLIRETYGDETVNIESNSIDVIAEDGRVNFTIDFKEDGSLEIHTASIIKHNDVLLDSEIAITSKGSNWFKLSRTPYKTNTES